jgi:orotidine-5'-phosphate decarboxylase
MANSRLIVALDFSTFDEVKKIVTQLGDTVTYYKVGMELHYAAGPAVITYLKDAQKNVFLDLKLHDIPNTVARSAAALTRLGVDMLNVHASGGPAMMSAAAEAVAEEADKRGAVKPSLIAVTILTSINCHEWAALQQTVPIAEQAVYLARLAKECGFDGVVASAQEAANIRTACGSEFHIVTPGIRPIGADSNDQSRITTPSEALAAGSSHLVVGRPITASADPAAAARQIIDEMRKVI